MEVAAKSSAQTVQRTWLLAGRDETKSSSSVDGWGELPEAVKFKFFRARKMVSLGYICASVPWARRTGPASLQAVCLANEVDGEVLRQLERFIFIEAVFGHQPREVSAIDAAGHVVTRGNGEEGA